MSLSGHSAGPVSVAVKPGNTTGTGSTVFESLINAAEPLGRHDAGVKGRAERTCSTCENGRVTHGSHQQPDGTIRPVRIVSCTLGCEEADPKKCGMWLAKSYIRPCARCGQPFRAYGHGPDDTKCLRCLQGEAAIDEIPQKIEVIRARRRIEEREAGRARGY